MLILYGFNCEPTCAVQDGDASELIFVTRGLVQLIPSSNSPSTVEGDEPSSPGTSYSAICSPDDSMLQAPGAAGTFDYAPGGIVGVAEFVLNRPRSFKAVAAADRTSILRMSRSEWLRCAQNQAEAHARLQEALLRLICLQEIYDPLHYPVIA